MSRLLGHEELFHFTQRFQIGRIGYELPSFSNTDPPFGVELFRIHTEAGSVKAAYGPFLVR